MMAKLKMAVFWVVVSATQKTAIFILTTVRTSNHKQQNCCYCVSHPKE
jgi:hypothetical protein